MRKVAAKTTYATSAAGLPHEQLARHIAALGLPDRAAYRAWCREQGFGQALFKPWRQRGAELARAEKLVAEARERQELERHIQQLGMPSMAAYTAWCQEHGRSVSLHKSVAQLAAEKQAVQREKANRALAQARDSRRCPEEFIRAIFDGSVCQQDLRTDAERELFALVGLIRPKVAIRSAFLRLIDRFECDIDTLTHQPVFAHLGWDQQNTLLAALFRLATLHNEWVAPPETWKVKYSSPRRRFGSLVRHLCTRYSVPAFMDAAWFEGEAAGGQRHMDWFLHLGAGHNLRAAAVPIELTKRMAHAALRAPGDTPIEAALRWGQVRGMRGTVRLARAVVGSRLGAPQADEPFWATVVQFLVNNPMLDPSQVGPIVDFLYNQRFVSREVRGQNGEWARLGPPQPDLTMKGRTAIALVRLVEDWHRTLAIEKRPAREWTRSGFAGFEAKWFTGETEETAEVWTVEELLSSKELHQEGRFMSNCVATYASSCASGESSIWSMRKRSAHDPSSIRVMTVEVANKTRQVVQARGRFNTVPRSANASADLKAAPEVLRRWAAETCLTVSPHAC